MKYTPLFLALLMILLNITNSQEYFGKEIYYSLMGALFFIGLYISIKYHDKKKLPVVVLAVLLSIFLYFIEI